MSTARFGSGQPLVSNTGPLPGVLFPVFNNPLTGPLPVGNLPALSSNLFNLLNALPPTGAGPVRTEGTESVQDPAGDAQEDDCRKSGSVTKEGCLEIR